jgi:hypothetical protein
MRIHESNLAARVVAVIWLITVLGIGLSMMFVGGAQAQANGTSNGSELPGEQIDSDTRIIDSSVSNGTATVVLESDRPQAVTLADAGGFSKGGVIERRTVVLSDGERSQIEIPVTEVDGRYGVSISTDKTLYAEIIRDGSSSSSVEPPDRNDQLALVVGAVLVGILSVVYARYRRDRQDQGVRYVG